MTRRLVGIAVAVGTITMLASAAPAFAGGNDNSNGTPIRLSVTGPDSSGAYAFTVDPFNGSAVSVTFFDGKADVDNPVSIGSCTVDGTNVTLGKNTLTCSFVPTFPAGTTGKVDVQAEEYSVKNPGNDYENNEVKEESNLVTIDSGLPQNNLPEAPYAVMLPLLAVGGVLLVRKAHSRIG